VTTLWNNPLSTRPPLSGVLLNDCVEVAKA
jgi:hypothetical protein